MSDDTLHGLIADFLVDNRRSAWLFGDIMHLYLRKNTLRVVHDTGYRCVDIANVSINNPQQRGHGVFRAVLAQIEAAGMNVYVEIVLDPWLDRALLRRGYQRVGDRSYVKRVEP